MALPVVAVGNDTDTLNFANGLRYKLCGKYNGTQSLTFLIVCIFILIFIFYFWFDGYTRSFQTIFIIQFFFLFFKRKKI